MVRTLEPEVDYGYESTPEEPSQDGGNVVFNVASHPATQIAAGVLLGIGVESSNRDALGIVANNAVHGRFSDLGGYDVTQTVTSSGGGVIPVDGIGNPIRGAGQSGPDWTGPFTVHQTLPFLETAGAALSIGLVAFNVIARPLLSLAARGLKRRA